MKEIVHQQNACSTQKEHLKCQAFNSVFYFLFYASIKVQSFGSVSKEIRRAGRDDSQTYARQITSACLFVFLSVDSLGKNDSAISNERNLGSTQAKACVLPRFVLLLIAESLRNWLHLDGCCR